MGQKVNPYGLRLGIINDWRTRWYTEKDFAAYLSEDIKIRRHVLAKLSHAGLSKIEIERTEQHVKVVIHAGRPGIVIGKKGVEVDKLRAYLEKLTGKRLRIDIQEVRRPEISAPLIAQNIAQQLEGRVSFRRAMKKAVSQAMAGGAKGVRISSAGRLGGAEMSRTEWYREGRVPLHTLKADIEYGTAEANTKSGKIGVKTWVYHGDVPLRGKNIQRDLELGLDEENARPMPPRPKRVIEKPRMKQTAEVSNKAEVPAVEVTEVIVEVAPQDKAAAEAKITPKKTVKAAEAKATKPAPVKKEPKTVVKKTTTAIKEAKTAPKKPVAKKETKTVAKKPAAKKPIAKKPAVPTKKTPQPASKATAKALTKTPPKKTAGTKEEK